MLRSRRFYLSLLGGFTWSATAADAIFSIIDAVSLSAGKVSFAGLPITASALDVVAVCCVGLFSMQYAWRREGIIKDSVVTVRIVAGLCISLSLIALIVSLVTVVTIKRRIEEVASATIHAPVRIRNGYITAEITIWTLTCLAQAILYSSPIWVNLKKPTAYSTTHSGPRDSVMSEIRHSAHTANLYTLEPTQPSSPLAALPSPTFSAGSSHSLRSWRESLNQVVRPVTSRTKLISRPSYTRESRSVHSDSQSIEDVSRPDGFETWDTSSVDPVARDAVMGTAPSRGRVLEPIPGSRPVSPARALDGPFPLPSDEPEPPALPPPPKMVPDTSRPPSPVVSEAHIHPLFRSESPIPPPEVTPGTNVLASPLASQMIPLSARPYSRMRSNSRAGQSPLVHSRSFQGSFQERPATSTSQQTSTRSPSPPSRPMTPPIPEFVLNSSPRSSTSGVNSMRKVTL